jgi:hypothetical protein
MIRVKISHPFLWSMTNQFPGPETTWGNCRFFLNERVDEVDFWIVLMDLPPGEPIVCRSGRNVLVILEFPEIKPNVAQRFIDQFDTVFSFGRTVRHPRVIETWAPFPWMLGMAIEGMKVLSCRSFAEIEAMSFQPKPREISVISSSKTVSAGHRQRLKFVEFLQEEFGNRLDVFGRGIKTFRDKIEAIGPYRYHLALENSCCPNGMSEKLYDAYLGEAFPLYYGCPNVGAYFPKESFTTIDINEPRRAAAIIRETLDRNAYEEALPTLRQCKRDVLYKYNLFALLADFCEREFQAGTATPTVRIAPEKDLLSPGDRMGHYVRAVKRRWQSFWSQGSGN